ncbi:hypothetical protein NHX12_005722 [Muraenolepis orangiensis]|uniref:Uncharacterized protein n=1 Tax=Muraenolepis orangiensis TaxID=630683 RepID=A0A9Q0DVK0_9TELE|nr:hypothetical protein NHX12_005722 [Muraenolepis orangiensis]
MFRVQWDQSDMGSIRKAAVATFYDIYEDGILDMLVLSQVEGKADLIIHAFKNNFEADAYFVKVIGIQGRWAKPSETSCLVTYADILPQPLGGLHTSRCVDVFDILLVPSPYGVNQPGPYVMYTTVDSNGNLKNASGQRFYTHP